VTSRRRTARLAGALYVAMSLFAAVGLVYFPGRFVVQGDAAATASRIVAAPLLYRLWSVTDLVAGVFAIYLAMTLYQLFKDVDRNQARVLVAMLLVQVPMWFALTLTQLAPRVLLNGSSYWSVFDKPQLDALALGFLGLSSRGVGAMSAYSGLWLLPLGLLVYRSGFIPRMLGVFLIVAGCSYLISAATYFILPAYYGTVFWGAAPLYGLGEISIVGWLLIKGAREDAA
jgi:uncharacterized protein DUF4386